jgi:CsoR family transcriptional regulator, copper-sensing transcriptional repressor
VKRTNGGIEAEISGAEAAQAREETGPGAPVAGDAPVTPAPCGCGCVSAETPEGTGPAHRHAVGVDLDIKDRNLKRLRRIEGQVRGLQRMVDEDRYCADIMTQISSVQQALRSVGRELMRNHLKHCAAEALRSGDPERSEAMYDELLELVYKHVR